RKRVIPILDGLTQIFGSGNLSNVEKLNRLLSQYKVYSQVKATFDQTLFFTEVPYRGHITTAECDAVMRLIKLAEMGAVGRIKKCQQCGKWFYARFTHQDFCAEECRVKHNAQSERAKEYRRDKAREYYWRDLGELPPTRKTGKVRRTLNEQKK